MSADNKEPVCIMCKMVRIYLVVAVPLVIAMAFGPETNMRTDMQLTQMASWFFGIGLIAIVSWRAYQEYWRK
jgi:hypothetical protein